MRIRNKILVSLLSILLLFSLTFTGCTKYKDVLVIHDFNTGKEYMYIEMKGKTEFSIDFIHSVNKSNVKEKYTIDGNEIVCDTLVYSAFGAGMPDNLDPSLTLSYDNDGNMIISGYNIRFNNKNPLTVAISIPYDHILTIGDKEYSLGSLIGHGTVVTISYIK